MNREEQILSVLKGCGVPCCGICSFEPLSSRLLPVRAASRQPQNARSVICALFPYKTGEESGNLSRYAAVPDYHTVAGGILERAARELKNLYPEYSFEPFCDNSPIPEVYAAALCGLGVVGQDGLLIHPTYGSWVFIGEIVTDLFLMSTGNTVNSCIGCGKCREICPSGALWGESFDKNLCLSHITQKKGELTEQEQALIRANGLVWGCDACQECCPMNADAQNTPIRQFSENVLANLAHGEAEKLKDRAFNWRGPKVIERNLCIFETDNGNTDGKK